MISIIETDRCKEDSYTGIIMDIVNDGNTVGHMSLMVDEKSCYLERIDITPSEQGKGYGSSAMQLLTRMYNTVYAAPDNPDSQRLFARIGEPYEADEANYVDQGYGVYLL